MLAGPICCQTAKPEGFDNCIAACQEGACQHPLPLLAAMKNNADRRRGIGISSSVLGMCPRQHVLQERNEYYEDPNNFYQRWRGSFGHYAIEMGGPYAGVVQERRFRREMEVDGVNFAVSGQPDWIDIPRRHLEDHKFVGWPPKDVKPDHEAQINVYKWIIDGGYVGSGIVTSSGVVRFQHRPGEGDNPLSAGFTVASARINYLHTRGYVSFDVPLWTTEAVERYIRRKLVPHAAYIKTGNLALLKIEDEADKWKAKYCPFRDPANPGQCCMD
jgi:hypothetical protein